LSLGKRESAGSLFLPGQASQNQWGKTLKTEGQNFQTSLQKSVAFQTGNMLDLD
jgi:hypothetical protein